MWDSLGSCTCRIAVVVLIILVILLVLIILCQGGRGILGGAEESDIEGVDQKIYDTDEELEDMESLEDMAEVEGGRKGKDIAIREPLYKEVAAGKVKVVARLNRGPFKEMAAGSVITIRRSRAPDDKTEYGDPRRFKAKVVATTVYPTFTALLEKEGHKELGYKTAKEALSHLHEFMPEADEKEHGVVAISIEKL